MVSWDSKVNIIIIIIIIMIEVKIIGTRYCSQQPQSKINLISFGLTADQLLVSYLMPRFDSVAKVFM